MSKSKFGVNKFFAPEAMHKHKAGVFVVKKNDFSIAVYFQNLPFVSRALIKAKSI